MKPTKNKKRNNPRYHLNEAYGMPPAGDISAFGPLSREVPEESGTTEPKEIQRREYANEKRGLMRTNQEDEELIRSHFSGYEVIDPLNYNDVTRATQTSDPNIIIPLGTMSDGSFVFAKSADDRYYKIPRG